MKIFNKKKQKRGPAQPHFQKSGAGFVILFAVTLAAIFLAIALDVGQVALKEVNFSTNARDTNDAFFAADSGVEQAFYNDKTSGFYPDNSKESFIVSNLGSTSQGCANVTVNKTASPTVTITAKGYNIGNGSCNSANPNRVERELVTTYGGGSSIPLGNSASFVKIDTTTQGSWHGVYGADGYNIFGANQNYPTYVSVTPSGNSLYTWADPTGDTRGLYKDSVTTNRIAATWYSNTNFTLDVNITDGASHQVSIYMVDWDSNNSRQAKIEVLDGTTSGILDTQNLANYSGGDYLVYNVSGHVIFRFTNIGSGGNNVVTSGIFFR